MVTPSVINNMSLTADDLAGLAAALQKLTTGSAPTVSQTSTSSTAAVALKLPPFWRDEPTIWFEQIEASFTTKGITTDQTKRDYVVAALDNETAREVKQAITKPPATGKYDSLKSALINAFDRSQEQKDAELLSLTDIGDRRPSAHLRHLRNLNSDGTSLLRAVFLSHLPTDIRTVVQAQGVKDLDQLAEAADRAIDARDSRPATTAAVHTRWHKGKNNNSRRDRDNTQGRDRPQEHFLCHFHKRFGKQARRCAPGCLMNTETTSANTIEMPGNE